MSWCGAKGQIGWTLREQPLPGRLISSRLVRSSGGSYAMNRRHFLATSAAAATLAAAPTVAAQRPGRLKVLIPSTPPDQLAELSDAAPGVELVPCQNDAEALRNVEGAHASYGFISRSLVR